MNPDVGCTMRAGRQVAFHEVEVYFCHKVEDEADPLSDPNKDWVDYWRNLFPKVIKTK